MLGSGEYQVAPTLDGIRRDHCARYEWAAKALPPGSRVLDVACGVGYGAFILAEAGHIVQGIDRDEDAVAYGQEHYAHERVTLVASDVSKLTAHSGAPRYDAVTCFETIEHVEDAVPLLKTLAGLAPVLLASVPNEAVFPFKSPLNAHRGYAFHHRHYRRSEFDDLLRQTGWTGKEWLGQIGPTSEVEPEIEGRTLVIRADRAEAGAYAIPAARASTGDGPAAPKHVAILGLGPSMLEFVDNAKRMGGRRAYCDEVWAINALGDVIQCDRVFHMDDVRIQEIRAAALPEGNIAAMLSWLKTHPGPIYTSRTHPNYPGLVAFPLEDVINKLGYIYFNNTAAYALAYALYLGVEEISFFGIDFTYPNMNSAEKGRACVEFWLGVGAARGIRFNFANRTTLFDAIEGDEAKLYGYDTVDVKVSQIASGEARVDFSPKEKLPTAAEIEARYDHGKHPSALVKS